MGTFGAYLTVVGIFLVSGSKGSSEPWLKTEKHAERGSTVELPCILKLPQCVGLHSIKWYRETTRIFIFSEDIGLTRSSNDLATRSNMTYEPNTTASYLKIPNLKIEDEGLFRCEATYLAVNRECNNVQHIRLTVTVKPDNLEVTNELTGESVADGSALSALNEGTKLILNCKSGGGKPVPSIEWFNGTQPMKAHNTSDVDENGIGSGTSRLEVVVTRGDLGAQFECRASSLALREPLSVRMRVNVNVRPLGMDLNGVVNHVIQGSRVLLQCVVNGARPAANVTWYNGTDLITNVTGREIFPAKIKEAPYEMRTSVIQRVDGTFETESNLAFKATRWENGKKFSCHAENIVTRQDTIKPMKDDLTLEVLYPPIVTVSPDNVTVNETEEIRLFCFYIANPATLLKVKWLRNGDEVNLAEDRYEGGLTEATSLMIKNATPTDMGMYTCALENSVGESVSNNTINVSVLHKPIVEVSMEPQTPVNEADRLNVSLTCDVQFGNPTVLTAVRWYLDGDLLKELPDCVGNSSLTPNDESSTFCDIDPSKLLLEVVGRSFHGNYSCEGRNEAGWGPVSNSTPVVVYYKPGPASISYKPAQVVKNGGANITCSVADMGRPEATEFRWYRGQYYPLPETKSILVIDKAGLDSRANYTCLAHNEAGDGDTATVYVDISAPPAFVKKLPPYHGFVYNAANVSIECRVECIPLCSISWLKDDVPMDFTNNDRYNVSNTIHPANPDASDFESVHSTLIWNLTAWPNGQLDRLTDNGKFTCESTRNSIGPGVKSTTHFHVEFPPENTTTSKQTIDVVEGQVPERVICTAKAHPEPTFKWYREDSTEAYSDTSALIFSVSFPRRSAGNYICESSNRHGKQTATTYINVQYKPTCQIEKKRIDGEDYLVCSATANPNEVDYNWSLKSDNDTLEQVPEEREDKSYLMLDPSVTNFRTYVCIANNTIGDSTPCECNMAGNLPWWARINGDLLLIVIIVAVVVVLAIIVVCIVIFLICRRKRDRAKYNNRVVHLEERDRPDGGAASGSSVATPVHPTPAPRWPLKPGVLVHVNRAHSLRSGLAGRLDLNLTMPRESQVGNRSDANRLSIVREAAQTVARTPVRAYRRTKNARRALSMSNVHEDGMLARANRIRAMFGAQFKDSDTFPGISRGKTAVTYKRIAPRQRILHDAALVPASSSPSGCQQQLLLPSTTTTYDAGVSRKRKKPGADPTQAANNNHVDSVSEGLPEPETKTFYENLPFHGIQTPPNKLVSPKFARVSALHGTLHSATSSPASSRPPSRGENLTRSNSRAASRTASPCGGSSGYGSTRSHLGPHYSPNNMPRNNSPEPKCNSLKPRRRKHKHAQFYSLRLCRRHRNTHQNYQLYAVPIRKTCPHKSDSSSTLATAPSQLTIGSSEDTSKSSLVSSTPPPPPPPPPPKPAPRARRDVDLSQHTYQNVPSPIFPQNVKSGTATKIKNANLYNYQEHYQQHQQELQQYGYPIASGSSNQLTLPLTRSLHHSTTAGSSPPQTTSSSSAVHLNHRHSLPRALIHGSMEMDLVHDHQPQRQGNGGGRRHERRKYRKHGNERKQKQHQQQRRQDARHAEPAYTFSRETSFNHVQEPRGNGGIENSYKISYPHYYEDSISACPSDYPPYGGELREHREIVDRLTNSSSAALRYTEPQQTNCTSANRGRSKNNKSNKISKSKRYSGASRESQSRPPSAPPAPTPTMAELHFRDVGQEIDV